MARALSGARVKRHVRGSRRRCRTHTQYAADTCSCKNCTHLAPSYLCLQVVKAWDSYVLGIAAAATSFLADCAATASKEKAKAADIVANKAYQVL